MFNKKNQKLNKKCNGAGWVGVSHQESRQFMQLTGMFFLGAETAGVNFT